MPDDLSHLFPQLASQFSNWDGSSVSNDGHDDPNHGGVTDDDIEAYLSSIGSLRSTPFASNGRAVPPGGGEATVEPPDLTSPEGGTAAEVTPGETGEEQEQTPPSAPAPPNYVEIDGRRYDIEQARAWAQFDQMVQADTELREAITNRLRTRGQPTGTPQPSATPPPVAVPELPPEYADDPYFKQLHAALTAQQDILDRVSRQSQQAVETATSVTQRTYADIAQGAISEFQQKKALDDNTMLAVSGLARRSGFVEKYMDGFDPLTGAPVKPDPYQAVTQALETAYYMAPETRELELSRQMAARDARAEADRSRKEKLGGVSGAAGSVPRTQPVPSNPQDARAAMVSEVAGMLTGNWTDGSQ